MAVKYRLQACNLPSAAEKGIKQVQSRTALKIGQEELVREIIRQGSTVGAADVAAVLVNIGTAVAALCARGAAVSIPRLGTFTPRAAGSQDSSGKWIREPNGYLTVRIDPGLKKEFASLLQMEPEPARTPAPEIRSLISGDGLAEGLVRPGQGLIIRGKYLKFNRKNEEEGVFFVQKQGGKEVRAKEIVRSCYSEIAVTVPRGLLPGTEHLLFVRARLPRRQKLSASAGVSVTVIAESVTS